MSNLKNILFKVSQGTGKASSVLSDLEAISSGDPKRIAKRVKTKIKNKAIYGLANKISKK